MRYGRNALIPKPIEPPLSSSKAMNILGENEIRETVDYIEDLTDAPDNTSGAELVEYAARLCRDINE